MVKGKTKANEKLKFDNSTTVVCPSCGEDVRVGTAGPAGLVQHEGKAPCRKAQDKRNQKKNTRTLFDVGLKKAKDVPPTKSPVGGSSLRNTLNGPPPIVVGQTRRQMEDLENDTVLRGAQERCGSEQRWELMTELKEAEDRMDLTIPLGKEGDEISSFGVTRAMGECLGRDKDAIWELVNPDLDRLLGFGRPASEIQALLRRGNMGVTGFRKYLTHLVEVGGVEGMMLEGKVKRLIDAINETTSDKDSPSTRQCEGTAANPVVVDSVTSATTATSALAVSDSSLVAVASCSCPGILLSLAAGVSPYSAYPFKLHDIFSLPWNIHIVNNQMWFRSTHCMGKDSANKDACRRCRELLLNTILEGIKDRIEKGVHENTPLAFQPIESLIELLRRKNQALDTLRFTKLTMARKIIARAKTLDTYKKFVMALADGNVNRVDALIRAGLNNNAGINGLFELLDRASKGLYKPKNFTEEEMLKSVLFLRLGGSRVADLAHKSLDHAGISTIRRSTAVTCLSPCIKTPTNLEIRGNIQKIFKGTDLGRNYGYVLMIDEIKLEERPRWEDKTNKILGLCREHTKTTELDFCSIEVAKAILQGVLEKKVHWASEASVFSFGILSGERASYGSRPFVISGTCKREKAEPHADLIQTIIDACNDEATTIGPPMYCVASDGESRRGSALIILTHKRPLSSASPIFPLVADLRLMNLLVGDHDLTADKDYKHVVKRLRNLLLRKMGTMVNGVHITPALLRFHLKENKVSQIRLDYLLNPLDRQNVPLCYSLLKEVWSLPDPALSDTPSFAIARRALQLLGSLFRHIVIPFIQINLSLHEQLAHLSAAAHLATYLYTVKRARNKALATLTFRDIILLVKNAYFCVAKTKVSVPDGKFWLILLGTDRLESTFGLVRSMIGTDQNADILQLSTRLSHAVECLNIFEKKPEWDRGPKRLKLPAIEDGNGDILAKVDHINPSSWKGDVRVAAVSLLTSWNLGREMAESRGPDISHLFTELDIAHHDMAFPFGQDVEDDEPLEADEFEDETTLQDEINASGVLDTAAILAQPIFGLDDGPLLDIEEHVSIEASRNGKGKFDPFVDVDGKKVSKPRALRELWKAMVSSIPGSTNRLGHVSTHLLFDESLDITQQLCGLCFRPAPFCVFYLRKGRGVGTSNQIDMKASRCPNLLKAISYHSAATESASSPCTNVPLLCPLCPATAGAVWKYNMKTHFAINHPSAAYESYSAPFTISDSERAKLLTKWNKRHTKKRRTNTGAKKKNKLSISEAHSTRRVFSDIPPEGLLSQKSHGPDAASADNPDSDGSISESDSDSSSGEDELETDSGIDSSDIDSRHEANEDINMDTYCEDRHIDQHQDFHSSIGSEAPSRLSVEANAVIEPMQAGGSVDGSLHSQEFVESEPLVASPPQPQILLATHQTEFNMDALPTRRGRPRRTRDMAEIYVCICGNAVDMGERVMGSETAVRCGFEGCETSWYSLALELKFHLECLNLECVPRNWRCENHMTRSRKRARLG